MEQAIINKYLTEIIWESSTEKGCQDWDPREDCWEIVKDGLSIRIEDRNIHLFIKLIPKFWNFNVVLLKYLHINNLGRGQRQYNCIPRIKLQLILLLDK